MSKEGNFNKNNLIELFDFAIKSNMKYVAVEIDNSDYGKPEIIINERENFKDKFDYYLKAYDDNLILKSCAKIKIKNVFFSKNLRDIFVKIK